MEKVKQIQENELLSLKKHIHTLNEKIEQLLLWSNICALWSYVILIIMMARLYASFEGQPRALMIATLGSMYIFLAALLLAAWKNPAYKHVNLNTAGKTYFNNHIGPLSRQCKWFATYLVAYALLLAVGSVFFLKDIYNGLTLTLKLTAPVNTIAYLLGIYFIIKFKSQQVLLEQLGQHADHIAVVAKTAKN